MTSESNITTNDVLSWLAEHPKLLIDHPELIEQLSLPHDVSATSLIEHQVARLRERNRELELRLEALTSIAGENEQLIRRLHRLTLAVSAQPDAAASLAELVRCLGDDFRSDAVAVHLLEQPQALEAIDGVTRHGSWPEELAQLIERGRIECGRLTRAKLTALFGQSGESLGSAAIVPVDARALLAIGSTQVERFHPGMGTLFLELLADTLKASLTSGAGDHRKRA